MAQSERIAEVRTRLQSNARKVENNQLRLDWALASAIGDNCLLIGTLDSQEEHYPDMPVTRHRNMIRLIAQGGTVLRACAVPETAILCGAFGDCNVSGQLYTTGSELVAGIDQNDPDRPTYGWAFDRDAEGFRLNMPGIWRDMIAAKMSRDVLGAVDVVYKDSSFHELNVPHSDRDRELFEPGHFVSRSSHQTLASFPVRGYDLLEIPAELTMPMLTYRPALSVAD